MAREARQNEALAVARAVDASLMPSTFCCGSSGIRMSGTGKIKGLVLGNPASYQTPHAFRVDDASLALTPSSIFSDKVIIKSIRVESPNIYYEIGLGGDNLRTIMNNISASKKLQVDDLVMRGRK